MSPDNSDATQAVSRATPANASATPVAFPPPRVLPLDPPSSAARAGAGATILLSGAHDALLAAPAHAIPQRVLAAYVAAANNANQRWPGCGITWYLLAGIGDVESDHGRAGGSDRVGWTGVSNPPIYGPLLDGSDGVSWPDTDGGSLDGSRAWDRAVGPMQFMPSSWAVWAADGNHDHRTDPQQIDDATLAAADYLCAAGGNLTTAAGRITAVYSYNHSFDYVRDVLSVAARYAGLAPKAFGTDRLPAAPTQTVSPTPNARSSISASPVTASPAPERGASSPSPTPSAQASAPATPTPEGSAAASASQSPADVVTPTP